MLINYLSIEQEHKSMTYTGMAIPQREIRISIKKKIVYLGGSRRLLKGSKEIDLMGIFTCA